MKPIYKIGDKVRIKDKISYLNSDHPKQKHAGAVMTVMEVLTNRDGDLLYYLMEEDQKNDVLKWAWHDCDIDGYAEEFEDSEPFDDSTFPEITFEQLLAATVNN